MFKLIEFVHSYLLEQSIYVLRVVRRYFFHSVQIYYKTFCKQTVKTLTDAVFCRIWSVFALFVYVPQKRRYTYLC